MLQHVEIAEWSVRRFTALDMYGTEGTQRRQRAVTAEFVVGSTGLLLLAVLLLRHREWLWATWALGCGANYGALVTHAVSLYPRDRLMAELDGVDVCSELRRYSIAQLLLFVPALIAVVAAVQAFHRER